MCTGADLPQRRGQAALALLDYPWQGLGFTIEFKPARKGYLGMTYPAQRHIVLWVRSCQRQSQQQLLSVLAHEVGHAVDVTRNDGAWREHWMQIRDISPQPWFGCAGCEDYATPAGDFAETFALLITGVAPSRSAWGAPPRDQWAHLRSLFR